MLSKSKYSLKRTQIFGVSKNLILSPFLITISAPTSELPSDLAFVSDLALLSGAQTTSMMEIPGGSNM